MTRRARITIERVRQIFCYDPATGIVTRRIGLGKASKAGQIAGGVGKDGYWQLSVDSISVEAHRVIWAMVKGEWPTKIDHIDLDKSNNRWENLRVANASQNKANCPLRCDNTSGYKGVYKNPYGKWVAQIGKDCKVIYLGTFDTAEMAFHARLEGSKKYHGEYARAA